MAPESPWGAKEGRRVHGPSPGRDGGSMVRQVGTEGAFILLTMHAGRKTISKASSPSDPHSCPHLKTITVFIGLGAECRAGVSSVELWTILRPREQKVCSSE